MNANRRMNGLLKAGIIVNGSYLALLLVQFFGKIFARELYGYATNGSFWAIVYMKLLQSATLYYLALVRPLIGKLIDPLIRQVFPHFYTAWPLIIGVCLASLAVSLIGVRHIAAGNRKKGAIMALIGTGMFFPLGLVGMIGAWQEMKKVGDSATSTSTPELETSRRGVLSSAAGTQQPSDVRMNTITIIGIVLNCIAALAIALQDDLETGLKAIAVVPAAICVIGAAAFATGSKKPGLILIQIGGVVLVPLGLIAVFGANKTMNELKRSQFHSEAQQ